MGAFSMGSAPARLTKELIKEVIRRAPIKRLELPVPPRVDHADHMLKTALDGWTKLAADHIVHPEMADKLVDVLGALARRAGIIFRVNTPVEGDEEKVRNAIVTRYRLYDLVLETIWNLVGVESSWAGFSESDVEKSVRILLVNLKEWEEI